MNDMKLIMEGWREYNSVDEQYDEVLAYILESYDGLLTEGAKEDIISGMKPIIKQFGAKRTTMALLALFLLGGLGTSTTAKAADDITAFNLPAAAQQMDVDYVKKAKKDTQVFKAVAGLIDKVEKDVKGIFGKGGELEKGLKGTFGKGGEIEMGLKDLTKSLPWNKNAPEDAPEDAPPSPPDAEEGFQQNAEAGQYEFRVAAEGLSDSIAEFNARGGLIDALAEKGLAGLKMSQDGNITLVTGTINGLGVHYDQANEQFVATWSPERAEAAKNLQSR